MRLPSLLKSIPATVLWCGPNSRTSPALSTTSAILPTEAAIVPLVRWAASLSIHLPFWLAISVALPSRRDAQQAAVVAAADEAVVRVDRRSATAPRPCAAAPVLRRRSFISAGSRRTRPSPSAKAAILPSRLKAQAATGASDATEREGGSVVRHSGFPRSSFTGLLQAIFEAALQVLGVEVAADEDQLAGALLAILPRRAPVGVHHHVHALEDVALGRPVDRQDALAAQDVAAAQLQQRAHPLLELVGIDRPVGGEADRLATSSP